jgi:hypothetical protein
MLRRVCLFVVCLCVSALSACESSSSPSGTFSGIWTGTAVENTRGQGTVRLVLDHRGGTIDGTLRTTFQNVVDRDGVVAGVAAGGQATLTFVPPQPFNCGAAGNLTGTVTLVLTLTGDHLSGSYSQFTCSGAVTATIDLTRGT